VSRPPRPTPTCACSCARARRHRIGRAGRFGTYGIAVTIVSAEEVQPCAARTKSSRSLVANTQSSRSLVAHGLPLPRRARLSSRSGAWQVRSMEALATTLGVEIAPVPAEIPPEWYAAPLREEGGDAARLRRLEAAREKARAARDPAALVRALALEEKGHAPEARAAEASAETRSRRPSGTQGRDLGVLRRWTPVVVDVAGWGGPLPGWVVGPASVPGHFVVHVAGSGEATVDVSAIWRAAAGPSNVALAPRPRLPALRAAPARLGWSARGRGRLLTEVLAPRQVPPPHAARDAWPFQQAPPFTPHLAQPPIFPHHPPPPHPYALPYPPPRGHFHAREPFPTL